MCWLTSGCSRLPLARVGVVITMTALAAIGEISRFESPEQLVGYAGLGAGVHDSGKEHRDKQITQCGRKELRWAMIEAASRRTPGRLGERFGTTPIGKSNSKP